MKFQTLLFFSFMWKNSSFSPPNFAVRFRGAQLVKRALSSSQAEAAFQKWLGSDSPRVLTSTADSPAGVMASYWKSVASSSEETVVIAPYSGVEWSAAQVETVSNVLEQSCSSFQAVYHPNSANSDFQSPYFALRHIGSSNLQTNLKMELPGKNDVMEGIFTWFQNQLLNFDSELDFVELGRKLLTIQEYIISDASTEADLLATCWEEAAKLSAPGATVLNEATGEERSVLIVAAGLWTKQGQEFVDFMDRQFSQPLEVITMAGMGKGEKLNLYCWGGDDGLKYPMVLIHPHLTELEPPEDAQVISFSELLKNSSQDE